jgi:hypothetical protein
LISNKPTFLQAAPAGEVRLTDGQFLLQEKTLNKERSLIYRAGIRRPTISKTEGLNLEPR